MALLTGAGAGTRSCLLAAAAAMVVMVMAVGVVLGLAFAPGAAGGCLALGSGGLACCQRSRGCRRRRAAVAAHNLLLHAGCRRLLG